jgi:hypothetical protein
MCNQSDITHTVALSSPRAAQRRTDQRRLNRRRSPGRLRRSTLMPPGGMSRRRSADRRPVPNDPDVARSGLEAVERLVEIGGGRLGRPALADLSNLARCGHLAQPAKRLGLRQPGGLGDLPGAVLATRELAKHPSHAIFAIRSAPCGRGRDRVRSRLRGRRRRLTSRRCGRRGRRLSVPSSTGGAHDHRFAAVRPDDRELAPVAPAAAHGAAATGALDRGKILWIGRLHPLQDRRPREKRQLPFRLWPSPDAATPTRRARRT